MHYLFISIKHRVMMMMIWTLLSSLLPPLLQLPPHLPTLLSKSAKSQHRKNTTRIYVAKKYANGRNAPGCRRRTHRRATRLETYTGMTTGTNMTG